MKHGFTLKKLGVVFLAFVLLLIAAYFFTDPAFVYRDSPRGITGIGNNPVYDLGLNCYGTLVLKHPEEAFEQAKIDCKDGFEEVRKQNKLRPISQESYQTYITLGSQLHPGDEELKKQGSNLSGFLDIYENSFDAPYWDLWGYEDSYLHA